MLYFILRPLTRIALKVYFRRITINGLENIPTDRAILLCCNHPTSFIEPCLLACFLPRTLHFLVRGDLFEKPVLKQILVSTNQMPIYRFRDGFRKLKDNTKVMNKTYRKLEEGGAILIFPEASTKETRILRPIKKGAARMALDMLKENPDFEISIVPIGVCYSRPNQWRSYVNVNIGRPIQPSMPNSQEDFRAKVSELTGEIETSMKGLMLHNNVGVEDEDLDDLVALGQWELPVKTSIRVRRNDFDKFKQERRYSEELKANTDFNFLRKLTYPDQAPARKPSKLDFTLVLLLSPFIFLALVINCIPILVGMYMRNKYVKQKEFYASVAIAASLGAYIIYFLIVISLMISFLGWWGLLAFLFPLLGLWGLKGYDYLSMIRKRWLLNRNLDSIQAKSIRTEGFDVLRQLKSNL